MNGTFQDLAKKRNYINVRVSESEKQLVDELSETLGTSKSDALRTMIWFTRIVSDPDITLGEMVKERRWNQPLIDILKPLPELGEKIGFKIKRDFDRMTGKCHSRGRWPKFIRNTAKKGGRTPSSTK
ncbi:MAG: hypothetical protein QW356_03880 [Candidatus Hadarchaeales archaeon]